ncbi:EF-P 5-aminopentanol modification-associated protein YfmH [Tuberibacillus sp. Marseille-P3662]|uniref:EF-P 5-aminopentanol modification-associated protein YfmH n=1 Tax=Tuberibacillus sp. Marseille-P3662 TaxID=1965358 RepID=UPI000A1C994A|nr:pitrilysin family protein [Tuberibacillus sp. Marseille-P3662]
MHKQTYDQLGETVYHEQLDNGLKLYVLPRPNYNKTFATFSTKYGSIDNYFVPLNEKEWTHVPDGIAHFLEHKMFESPDGTDVFYDFSKQGASPNAFTSFTSTSYLFSTTSQVHQNLETLIDFVQTPGFTEDSVEKEKGIIGQELQMYNDDPDFTVLFSLIKNMYEDHPVRIDIGGTLDSIQKIDKPTLEQCYQTFYHPSNMMLFVIGPVDPEEISKLVTDNQHAKDYHDQPEIKRQYPDESPGVYQKESETAMAVNTPKCLVGFKQDDVFQTGNDLLKNELAVQLLLDMMFGRGTENYQALLDENLIDDSFSHDFDQEYAFGFSVIGGNTHDPDRLAYRIKQIVDNHKSNGFSGETIERARNKLIGSFMRSLNSLEYIATKYTRYEFLDVSLFDIIPVLESIDETVIHDALKHHFKDECYTVSKIVQKESDEK